MRFYLSNRSYVISGMLLAVVGIVSGIFVIIGYASTGKWIAGYSTQNGVEYGSALSAVIPIVAAVAGVWMITGGLLAGIDVTDQGISRISRFGRVIASVSWGEATKLEQIGSHQPLYAMRRGLRPTTAVDYAVIGPNSQVKFDDTIVGFVHLSREICKRIPESAIDASIKYR